MSNKSPSMQDDQDLTVAYMAGFSKGKEASQQPLTPAQAHDLWEQAKFGPEATTPMRFLRLIERAHGIGVGAVRGETFSSAATDAKEPQR